MSGEFAAIASAVSGGRDGLVGLGCQGEQGSGAMKIRETSLLEVERLEVLKNGGLDLKLAEGKNTIH